MVIEEDNEAIFDVISLDELRTVLSSFQKLKVLDWMDGLCSSSEAWFDERIFSQGARRSQEFW